jgi:adenine deaminase
MIAPLRDADSLSELIAAGRGERPLDLILRGGRLLDVYRSRWIHGDVAVSGGRIAGIGDVPVEAARELDCRGRFVVPGLVEPHFHAGGSHLTPRRLAAALLARGTTTSVCDFQEHFTVAGAAAVRSAIDEAAEAGLRILYLVPIQAWIGRRLGTSGHLATADLRELLAWPETVAINEPPAAAVLTADPATLEIIAEALARGLIFSGHAPEVHGRDLAAYAATGASSDHESGAAHDAWEKLGLGMKVIMREGSASPDLDALVELARIQPHALRHMMLGTDEVDPVDLVELGHMDHKIRRAVAAGVDPIAAIQMATLNPAEYYRVDHEVGSLAPGRAADILVLDHVEDFAIEHVIASGRFVEAKRYEEPSGRPRPENPMELGGPLTEGTFAVPASGASAMVRVIEIEDGNLVSGAGSASLPVRDGSVACDPARDLAKLSVIDRYEGSRRIGTAIVRGFGLREGAVATTYAHPYYALMALGASEAAMARAGNRLAELGGGIVVVDGERTVHEWALPVVGVFSDEPLPIVRRDFEAINEAIRSLGCPLRSPVLALSFAALTTIPAYGLTDRGLYDTATGTFVHVVTGTDG